MGRHGENIRKRKDGRWEARVISSYKPDGKAIYRSVYGKTYLEAKEKRNDLLRSTAAISSRCEKTGSSKGKITLEEVAWEWLAARKDSIKESTYAHYTNLVRRHLLPCLGPRRLYALTPEVLDGFLREKLRTGRADGKGGLSPKTVADIRSVLLQILLYAQRRQYPCAAQSHMFYPKNRQSATRIMTREEQAKLETVLLQCPDPLHLGILTALYGGLRIGEVCALQWGDISLESGTIRIHKTMLRIQDLTPDARRKTKVLIDCPKTESSNRVIPMPSFLMAFLKQHRMAKDVYLLTGKRAYMEPRICLEKYKRLLIRAGLDSFTFHTLRHTFATRCVENGFDAKSLSEILGQYHFAAVCAPVHHLKAGADESSGKYFHSGSKLWSDGSASSLKAGISRTSFLYCSTLRVQEGIRWKTGKNHTLRLSWFFTRLARQIIFA